MNEFEQGKRHLDGIHLGPGGTVRSDPRNHQSRFVPHGYIWQRGTFTVPDSVSDERVQESAAKYRNKFGTFLEIEGFTVLGIEGPTIDRGFVNRAVNDPDRRSYVLWGKVTRKPVRWKFEVPDEDVALYQKAGFRLV